MEIKGKVAIVTGAAAGIGRAYAFAVADAGAAGVEILGEGPGGGGLRSGERFDGCLRGEGDVVGREPRIRRRESSRLPCLSG